MAISRAQLAKELEPGLNALFGMEYDRYENQHAEIYTTESSDRAFEEEVMLSGFGAAPTKSEGSAVNFDDANEAYTARYNHETVALAFSITEEAIEDNLYDRLGSRYTRALARSMAHSKQVKAAAVLNNAFTAGASAGGDGVALCDLSHPLTNGGTLANEPSTAADLNETSLEDALINIAGFVDERGAAPTKSEGSAVNFDDANEAYTARYNHETIALAFSITEEAVEDNLYDRLSSRYTRALARSMAHTKQVKAAAVLNNAFTAGASAGGDGVALCDASHPLTNGGTFANEPSTAADLNETSL